MFYAMEQALKSAFPLKKAFHKDRFAQWFPLCVAGCSALAAFPLTFASSDNAALFYTFVTVPIVCILLSVLSFKSQGRQRVVVVSSFSAFLIFTPMLIKHLLYIMDPIRWFAYGRILKAEVLSEPNLRDSSLRHVEWEGWGFAGSDTTVYLVFDPKNTLATAAKERMSGKFGDLPCQVYRIRKRESEWYTVQFYTDTDWDNCGN